MHQSNSMDAVKQGQGLWQASDMDLTLCRWQHQHVTGKGLLLMPQPG